MTGLTRFPRKGDVIYWPNSKPPHDRKVTVTRRDDRQRNIVWTVDEKGNASCFIAQFHDGELNNQATIWIEGTEELP